MPTNRNLIFDIYNQAFPIIQISSSHFPYLDTFILETLNESRFLEKSPCLYFLGSNNKILYVGISKKGLSSRWKISTSKLTPSHSTTKLTHSQCSPHLRSYFSHPKPEPLLIKLLSLTELINVINQSSNPLSTMLKLMPADDNFLKTVERWICNNQASDIASWNCLMTFKQGD